MLTAPRVGDLPIDSSLTSSSCRSYEEDEDELNCSPETPLLLSDVPSLPSLPSRSLAHSMGLLKAAGSSPSSHLPFSFLDLCLSPSPPSPVDSTFFSHRKRSPSSFSLSAWCASLLGCFCVAAVTALLVAAFVYGLVSPLKLSSASLPLLHHLSRNSTATEQSAAGTTLFPAGDFFAYVSSGSATSTVSASVWPFAAQANASLSHSTWVGLLSLLTSQPTEHAAIQEAVLVDGYAVASFNDLVAVMDRRANRPTAESKTAAAAVAARAQEVAIHVVSAPSNTARREELEGRLRSIGYSSWQHHSSWTRERLIKERVQAAQWLFPGFANASRTAAAGGEDDGADIGYGHLNMMEHIAVLQAIADSPASEPAFALILEDDAVPTPAFRQRISWIVSALPDDFDAVFFGGCLNLHPALKEWQAGAAIGADTVCEPVRLDRVLADCSVPVGQATPLLIPTVRSRCASGYLVSRASAARLLAGLQAATRNQDRFVPIDHSFNDVFAQMPYNHSTVYQLEPPASYESSKIIKLNQPATAPAPEQRKLDSIDYNAAVAFTPVPVARPKQSSGVHGVLAPSAGGAVCDLQCGWSRPFSAAAVSRQQSGPGTDWSSYISPSSFRDMSDWAYWRHEEVLPPHDRLRGVNETLAIACLPAGSFIYVQTTMIIKFFNEVHPRLPHPYFLITGSADQETPSEWAHYLDDLSADGVTPKLLHWFGQNGNSPHPRFTQIPIGINFHEMGDALDQTLRGHNSLVEGDHYTVDDGSLDLPDGEAFDGSSASKRFRPRINSFRWSNVGDYDKDKWLLANFALGSNTETRGPALVFACGNETAGVTGKRWAECVEKDSGVRQYVSSMPAVYHHNSRFRFHLSPEGNGLDCHRTWEALYLGIVPVVKSGPLDPLLADTPAWIVNEWSDISLESMAAAWKERTEKWRGQVVERLHFSYWRSKVIAVARHEMEQWKLPLEPSWLDMEVPRRRCWGPFNQRVDRKLPAVAA